MVALRRTSGCTKNAPLWADRKTRPDTYIVRVTPPISPTQAHLLPHTLPLGETPNRHQLDICARLPIAASSTRNQRHLVGYRLGVYIPPKAAPAPRVPPTPAVT